MSVGDTSYPPPRTTSLHLCCYLELLKATPFRRLLAKMKLRSGLLIFTLTAPPATRGFRPHYNSWRYWRYGEAKISGNIPISYRSSQLCASPTEDAFNLNLIDEVMIKTARSGLSWEIVEARERKPILDLSCLRDDGGGLSLAEDYDTFKQKDEDLELGDGENNEEQWTDGSFWAETKAGLREIGVLPEKNDDGEASYEEAEKNILDAAPQLLRLEPSTVLKTAEAILEAGMDTCVIREQPSLLTFPPLYIPSGVEFLSTMMASLPSFAVSACKAQPLLFVIALEGWIQEQAVMKALGSAGDATERANKRVVSDTAAALKGRVELPPEMGG